MRTAQEMLSFCTERKYSSGISQSFGIKNFAIIEKALKPDETVIFCFVGLHNYVSTGEHGGTCSFAFTKDRLMLAKKKVFGGEIFNTIPLAEVNNISYESGMIFGNFKLTCTTSTLSIGMDKLVAEPVYQELQNILQEYKGKPKTQHVVQHNASIDELKKYHELLYAGIITQEEFDSKKKQFLGQ